MLWNYVICKKLLELEDRVLNDISQTQEYKYNMFSFIWGNWNLNKERTKYQFFVSVLLQHNMLSTFV